MLQVKEIVDGNDITKVAQAAQADNHYVLGPTHYWVDEKTGEVRGYFSSGVIPHGHFWMHSQATPRESMEIIHRCEQISKERLRGVPFGIIACHPSSPFNANLEKHFGYKPVIRGTDLFYVNLFQGGMHENAKRTR